jgi:acetate kinase
MDEYQGHKQGMKARRAVLGDTHADASLKIAMNSTMYFRTCSRATPGESPRSSPADAQHDHVGDGINHQYCAGRTAELLGRNLADLKLVICHLANGCSLAAIRGGVSIDTTMGFTPLDGLMMGTRSGSVDPGIFTYLLRQGHLDKSSPHLRRLPRRLR